MKISQNRAFSALFLLALFGICLACTRQAADSGPGPIPAFQASMTSPAGIFPDSLVPLETFYVLPGRIPTMITRNGTKFRMGGYILNDNGTVCMDTTKIEIRMVNSIRDRIFAVAPANNGSTIFTTGGQFFFLASVIRNGITHGPENLPRISVQMQGVRTPSPLLVYQGTDANLSGSFMPNFYQPPVNMVWEVDPQNNSPIATSDSGITDPRMVNMAFSFPYNNMGWINADYPFNPDLPKTGVRVLTPGEYTRSNTEMFLLLPESRSLLRLYHGADVPGQDGKSAFYTGFDIPSQLTAVIIQVSKIGNQYFLAHSTNVLQMNHSVEFVPAPKTLKQIDDFLLQY